MEKDTTTSIDSKQMEFLDTLQHCACGNPIDDLKSIQFSMEYRKSLAKAILDNRCSDNLIEAIKAFEYVNNRIRKALYL